MLTDVKQTCTEPTRYKRLAAIDLVGDLFTNKQRQRPQKADIIKKDYPERVGDCCGRQSNRQIDRQTGRCWVDDVIANRYMLGDQTGRQVGGSAKDPGI
eukprot:scaffold185065_cov18-Prasinocladus_malaysianus.AAC.1